MEKKYWNKGAFMTGLNTMIVADEQRLDEIADPVIREAVRKQLEVKLPVHPDKVLIKMECVGVCGSDVHYFHEGQCGTFFLDPGRDIPFNINAIMDNEVQIRPIFRYRYIFPECIKAASASCPIEKVISDEYELDDIQTAFEDSISRKNEVVKAAIRIR